MYKTPFINAMLKRGTSTNVEESTKAKPLFNTSTYLISQCFYCENLTKNGCCNAYDEIPTIILENIHDHRVPYKNDNGVYFVKDERFKDEKIRIVSLDNSFPPKSWEV